MQLAIIFPNDSGGIAVCYPADCGIPVEEIARKDVPIGKPYRIIPFSEVPKDVMFFDAFEADFSQPNGYGIGYDAWLAERTAAGQV